MYVRGPFAVGFKVIALLCVLAPKAALAGEDFQNNVNRSASDLLVDSGVLSTDQNNTEKANQQAVRCKEDEDCKGRGKCDIQIGHLKFCSLVDVLKVDSECRELCGENVYCKFDQDKKPHCVCGEKMAFDSTVKKCKKCDCGPDSRRCYYSGDAKHCECKSDYEDVEGSCKATLACSKTDRCPFGTKCIDRPNEWLLKYDCECLKGYRMKNGRDPRFFGCDAIDQCDNDPCGYDKRCIYTPGSYVCVDLSSSGYRPFRTASIVIGIISGILFLMLLAVIFLKAKKSRP